ncbi:hypothetical protein [Tamaricihabitans halophyticus]|uniref:hypothetical protein n=1 Tax=Tamaricihabitans halophyticus TaxID=1262583 RepID=UPI001FB206A9|nr:hypothetical protein [Tamaricihabitans halophyticus]
MVLAPALIYFGVREFGLVLLSWLGVVHGTTMSEALTSWDGQWYLAIASNGYGGVPDSLVDAFGNRSGETPLAFFPGYPWVVQLFSQLPGVGMVLAALLASAAFGILAAYALARLGQLVSGGSRRAGLALVALFAASPMGIVLSMAYSEAMFCALSAWALVFVLERRWIFAGVCCALAGLVRPTAGALLLAVGLALLVAIVQRKDGWRPWLGALLAPVGLLGYLGWVGVQTGSLTGWFDLQERGWDSRFDGGLATVRFSGEVLGSARSVLEVGTVVLLVGAVALLVISWRRGLDWPLQVFSVGVLLMNLGSNGLMNSKARLLLPAFTLLIPIALALAKRKPTTMVLVLSAAAVGSAWFGAYALTGWSYAI